MNRGVGKGGRTVTRSLTEVEGQELARLDEFYRPLVVAHWFRGRSVSRDCLDWCLDDAWRSCMCQVATWMVRDRWKWNATHKDILVRLIWLFRSTVHDLWTLNQEGEHVEELGTAEEWWDRFCCDDTEAAPRAQAIVRGVELWLLQAKPERAAVMGRFCEMAMTGEYDADGVKQGLYEALIPVASRAVGRPVTARSVQNTLAKGRKELWEYLRSRDLVEGDRPTLVGQRGG